MKILNRFTSSVVYESEKETVKEALEEARKEECMVSGAICPEIHHINHKGMKHKEWAVIPLSFYWHTQFRWAIHRNKEIFRSLHGNEWILFFKILKKVIIKLSLIHQQEILQKIDTYAESDHASKQFLDAYKTWRVTVGVGK